MVTDQGGVGNIDGVTKRGGESVNHKNITIDPLDVLLNHLLLLLGKHTEKCCNLVIAVYVNFNRS